MRLDLNIISILDIAGFIQGMVLGLLLIFLSKRKHKSTFFLGLFLILFASQRLPIILRDLELYSTYSELYLLPLNFFWLLLPVFFIYTQQVSAFLSEKMKYWLLYPGILATLIQMVIFFLPYQTKLDIAPNLWRGSFFILGAIYSWAVGIWNIRLLHLHRVEVRNYYSMLESKELHWARVFLIFGITGTMLYMIQVYFIPENIYSRIFFLIFDLVVIYWVSYHGVVQRNILSLSSKMALYDNPIYGKSLEERELQPIAIEQLQKLMEEIDGYMNSSESFVHTELTVVDLAEKLKVHPKRISMTINTVRKQNFNSYVNRLRIKKAEKLLKNKEEENFSMEGIGNEVGFHSKSAFYSAFKKETGTTPTKYKQLISA